MNRSLFLQYTSFTLILTQFLFPALSNAGNRKDESIDDLLKPRITMDSQTAKFCPATVLLPFSINKPCDGTPDNPGLRGCTGIWTGVGCRDWNQDGYTSLNFSYYIKNIEQNDMERHFEIELRQENLNKFIEEGAYGILLKSDIDDKLIRSPDGLPQLASLDGDCGQERTRKIEVTPITGPNWSGWMWEQSFAEPKKKLKSSCQKFTPAYRCVALVFGNEKISAAFPSYCFLRKKVNDLDTELSFDVFMDMVETIRFKQGSIQSDIK